MAKTMDLDHARHGQQREIMLEAVALGTCAFCAEELSKVKDGKPVIKENRGWVAKHSGYPYTGAKLHLLFILKRHVESAEELSSEEKLDLFLMCEWARKKFGLDGFSFFLRSGNTARTGASMGHLHAHLIVGGDKPSGEIQKEDRLLVMAGYVHK